MHANTYQDSTGTPSVLNRHDAEECKSSEATWLPVAWRSRQSWRLPLHPKATERAVSPLSDNELPSPPLSAEPPLFAHARQYIEDHYTEELSLEAVAAALGTAASYLAPIFEQATGSDFSDHLAWRRVEKAKNLLLNPHYYFTEIASELGFESICVFNQAFARIVGEPPQAYRARLPAGFVA